MKCDKCKVQMCVKESKEPACCKWFIDNVFILGKSVEECELYEPIEEM